MAAKNFLFAIVWLLLLVFIAWPVAGICAIAWLFLQVRASETLPEKQAVAAMAMDMKMGQQQYVSFSNSRHMRFFSIVTAL
jgi:hypothetical protein